MPAATGLAEIIAWEVRRVGYGHPDALALIEEVQDEYVSGTAAATTPRSTH